MDFIYPISYLLSLAGLVSWFFVRNHKSVSRKASGLFLIAFLVYLVALSFSSATLSYKFLILFRDLVVLAVTTQLFNIFKRKKLIAIGLGAVAGLVVFFSYFNILLNTFPQIYTDNLDDSAEYLVMIPAEHESAIGMIREEYKCDIRRAFAPTNAESTDLDEFYIVDVEGDRPARQRKLFRKLRRLQGVEWVEPNEIIQVEEPANAVPPAAAAGDFFVNDPDVSKQWSVSSLEVDKLHRLLASSGIRPVRTARIAILDTGVDAGHEDLAANYVSSDNKSDSDPRGHGTHCAGIAGAVSNNGLGVASLPVSTGFIQITSFKVLNAYGAGSQQSIINGIIKAADSGADVISMSLGGRSQPQKERAYRKAVEYAQDQGAIVVVAAGNNNDNAKKTTPANVNGVIAVSAVGPNLNRAPFSNTVGNLKMAVAAPGVAIYSTLPGNNYAALNGTSMAAPYVSGLVGLMKSLHPDLTTEEAFRILNSTGRKIDDHHTTGRLVQPLAAIEEMMD